jgi:hypothetical protein
MELSPEELDRRDSLLLRPREPVPQGWALESFFGERRQLHDAPQPNSMSLSMSSSMSKRRHRGLRGTIILPLVAWTIVSFVTFVAKLVVVFVA